MRIMKTLKIIITLFILNINCAIGQIVDLDDRDGSIIANTYYKDTQNKLNQFEGTWVYDDGINYIKLILVKKYQFPEANYFEDILVGEIQYKNDGNEIINTLNKINANYSDYDDYSISGNHFWYNHTPFDEYTSDNFRLKTRIMENHCLSRIDIRTLTLNGQQAIQIFKRKQMEIEQACTPAIPGGFYYLIKQQ